MCVSITTPEIPGWLMQMASNRLRIVEQANAYSAIVAIMAPTSPVIRAFTNTAQKIGP